MLPTMWHLQPSRSSKHCCSSYLDLLQFLLELFVFSGLVLYEQGDHCPCPLQARSCLLMGHLFNVLTIHLRGETAKEGRKREEGEGGRGEGEGEKREKERGRGKGGRLGRVQILLPGRGSIQC